MRRGSFLDVLRRGRASWSVAILYLLLLPIALGVLPKPEATTEFLLSRDLATAEICTMPGPSSSPSRPVQHQPDCVLCSTACPHAGSAMSPPPAEEPHFLHFARALPQPKDFVLSASRRPISDIQPRGPPARS